MNPWLEENVTRQQAELVAHQLAEKPWPVHFTAIADAVRSVWAGKPTVLEVGCGVGQTAEILDVSGRPLYPGTFAGLDISPHAIAWARKAYPHCLWFNVGADMLPTLERRDIVIDGSCVLHVNDWRAHLEALCAASNSIVILHRLPIHVDGRPITMATETHGYGQTFPAWRFAGNEVQDEMRRHGYDMTEARMAHGDSATLTFRKVEG